MSYTTPTLAAISCGAAEAVEPTLGKCLSVIGSTIVVKPLSKILNRELLLVGLGVSLTYLPSVIGWVKERLPERKRFTIREADLICESSISGAEPMRPLVKRVDGFAKVCLVDGDGTQILVGDCCRMRDRIVFPKHLVKPGCQIVVLSNVEANQKAGRNVTIDVDDTDLLATDLLCTKPLSANDLSILGMKEVKTGPVSDRGTIAEAQSVVLSEASSGKLENAREIGRVVYFGNTKGGFSGGAYTEGNAVLGIHLTGGKDYNMGYATAYLASVIDFVLNKEKKEDTEDYILHQIMKGAKYKYQTIGEPGVYQLRDPQGYYHILDREAFGADYFFGNEYIEYRGVGVDYEDRVPEAGNVKVETPISVSSRPGNAKARESTDSVRALNSEADSLTSNQRLAIGKFGSLTKKQLQKLERLWKDSEAGRVMLDPQDLQQK